MSRTYTFPDHSARARGKTGSTLSGEVFRVCSPTLPTKQLCLIIKPSAIAASNFSTTVVVNSAGKLGVATSSARFKESIKAMDKASEAILALKPVTFRYKKDIDPDGIPQFGLVAEEVEKVNPDLVARDADGGVYTVRYDAVNVMLLNEFLKEHGQVQQLKAAIAQQQKQIENLVASMQEVSNRLEGSSAAPQLIANE